jgi:hypothetical protein
VRETDLNKLLRSIVDSAIALAGAERGFLCCSESIPGERPGDATGDRAGRR